MLTLREQLRQAARDGEDALERRSAAWHRLLATFRAVHGGVGHDRLRLPAYGGSLFDPDRFPFLEGRHESGDGKPLSVDDRTILAVLDALLTVEVGKGNRRTAQRLSYKALDVEQIGHCYEGLLDHGCAPVDELSVGLVGAEADEPELAVAELEQRLAAGRDDFCEWLSSKELCKKAPGRLRTMLEKDPDGTALARLRAACGHDDAAVGRVRPFWGLLRSDLRGLPVVFMPGSKYVTQTSTRRNTGTQYTTRALADEVVRYTLEPLAYAPGPADGAEPEEWRIRLPAELLALRVCDPAVGSGAILTAACRYLADRLIEATHEHGPGDGDFASRLRGLLDADPDDQVTVARREVVDHCLYGVDRNPVAAEMAKLSLWLTTMARERPFTFLDHAIQLGDSLLGITNVNQLRWLHLDPAQRGGEAGFEMLAIEGSIDEALELAEQLQQMSVLTVRDASAKQRLNSEPWKQAGEPRNRCGCSRGRCAQHVCERLLDGFQESAVGRNRTDPDRARRSAHGLGETSSNRSAGRTDLELAPDRPSRRAADALGPTMYALATPVSRGFPFRGRKRLRCGNCQSSIPWRKAYFNRDGSFIPRVSGPPHSIRRHRQCRSVCLFCPKNVLVGQDSRYIGHQLYLPGRQPRGCLGSDLKFWLDCKPCGQVCTMAGSSRRGDCQAMADLSSVARSASSWWRPSGEHFFSTRQNSPSGRDTSEAKAVSENRLSGVYSGCYR